MRSLSGADLKPKVTAWDRVAVAFVCVVLLSLAFCSPAKADAVQDAWSLGSSFWGMPHQHWSSKSEAFAAARAHAQSTLGANWSIECEEGAAANPDPEHYWMVGLYCYADQIDGPGYQEDGFIIEKMKGGTCPDGSVPDPATGECPPPPPSCTLELGLPLYISASYDQATGPPAAWCYQDCQYMESGGVRACIGGQCVGNGKLVPDTPCEPSMPIKSGPPENCLEFGGQEFCSTPQPENCGIINGEFMCVDSVPEGNCSILPDGSYICDADAPTAPTTPDGTAPAEPDMEITNDEGEPLEYFDPETVDASGTPTSGSESDTTDSNGDGLPDSEGEGEDPEELEGADTVTVEGWLADSREQELHDSLDDWQTVETLDNSFIPTLPSSSACQTIGGSVLGMYTFEFPSPSGCQKLGVLKDIVGWLFYLLTVAQIWAIVMRRREDI